jgi:hypothetical protein
VPVGSGAGWVVLVGVGLIRRRRSAQARGRYTAAAAR